MASKNAQAVRATRVALGEKQRFANVATVHRPNWLEIHRNGVVRAPFRTFFESLFLAVTYVVKFDVFIVICFALFVPV